MVEASIRDITQFLFSRLVLWRKKFVLHCKQHLGSGSMNPMKKAFHTSLLELLPFMQHEHCEDWNVFDTQYTLDEANISLLPVSITCVHAAWTLTVKHSVDAVWTQCSSQWKIRCILPNTNIVGKQLLLSRLYYFYNEEKLRSSL